MEINAFFSRRASSSDVRLVSVGGSPNRESRRRRENLNSCASRRTPHNDAPSPHAGPFRAIRRLATQGVCLASTSQRVSRRDRGARTWPPIRFSTRQSAAKARQEIHSKRTRLISGRHVRRRYVRSHRARLLRGLSAIIGMSRPSSFPSDRLAVAVALPSRVTSPARSPARSKSRVTSRVTLPSRFLHADASFPASLDRTVLLTFATSDR